MMITVEQTLFIHNELIQLYGGSQGVRDMGALESALARPFGSFSGQPYYSSTEERAAAILESILLNHPFVDGNKRTGFYLMLAILESDGLRLVVSKEARYDFVILAASGQMSFELIVAWIRSAVAKP